MIYRPVASLNAFALLVAAMTSVASPGHAAAPSNEFAEPTPARDGFTGAWSKFGEGVASVETQQPLEGNTPYLSVAFSNQGNRTIRRQLTRADGIDSMQPHQIRWKWRFDGKPKDFGGSYQDRINFFGAEKAEPGSNDHATWLIGIAAGSEPGHEVYEGKWFFFDRNEDGDFKKDNMVNTGLGLVAGAVYEFTVTVDPSTGFYDATISDGKNSFSESGLRFRNGKSVPDGFIHFGVSASAKADDLTFALGSLRVAGAEGLKLAAETKRKSIHRPQPLSAQLPISPRLQGGAVQVQLFEDLEKGFELDLKNARPSERYTEPAFAFTRLPTKYSANALPLDRSSPFVLHATLDRSLPAGEYKLLLRSKGSARLFLDDQLLLTTKPQKGSTDGHNEVPVVPKPEHPQLHMAHYSHQEMSATVKLDGKPHTFTLVALIGGKGLTPAPGELSVAIGPPGELPRLLGDEKSPLLTDDEWERFATAQKEKYLLANTERRQMAGAKVTEQWSAYHRAVREQFSKKPAIKQPDVSATTPVFNPIDRFIGARLEAAKTAPTPLTSDLEFLRRLSLDTIGLIPTAGEVRAFLADPPAERRTRAIERLLNHPGWADHWVGYWQDVLAENPGMVKPDLNNSGPFRWWIHQSFKDGIPFDRFVAELVEMEGSVAQGAPAAFKMASLNDAPLAAKSDIIVQAFLAEKLSCARCHDAPEHPHKQRDTFGLAAMLDGQALKLPQSSTVPVVEGFRKPKVQITLKPGEEIEPHWPFAQHSKPTLLASLVPVSATAPATRNQVAALLVSADNERFAKVVVNRVWKRYLGAGLVEPVEDWQFGRPSHPELLDWLAREFVMSGCDLKALARLIFSSHLYQRKPVNTSLADTKAEERLFAGPARRHMTAEQLVDSLYRCANKEFNCEELNINPAGNSAPETFPNLGQPRRAWEMTALMNERDRPALALPVAQSIVDVLTTYGWRQSRQTPATVRQDAPSAMQTLLLANGIMGTRIVRLSDDSAFTELALEDRLLSDMIRETFLRILSRPPTSTETQTAMDYLQASHSNRVVKGAAKNKSAVATDSRVGWANHLSSEATVIRMEEERRLRLGDAPTRRLTAEFREYYEDLLWSLINAPEFTLVP